MRHLTLCNAQSASATARLYSRSKVSPWPAPSQPTLCAPPACLRTMPSLRLALLLLLECMMCWVMLLQLAEAEEEDEEEDSLDLLPWMLLQAHQADCAELLRAKRQLTCKTIPGSRPTTWIDNFCVWNTGETRIAKDRFGLFCWVSRPLFEETSAAILDDIYILPASLNPDASDRASPPSITSSLCAISLTQLALLSAPSMLASWTCRRHMTRSSMTCCGANWSPLGLAPVC